jgi:hypothetical protein
MSKPIVIAEKIHLENVSIIKSHFEVSETYRNEDITSFSMGFKSLSGFHLKEHLLNFKLFIKIKGVGKNKELVGICGIYQIDFDFSIENLPDFVHREKGANEDDFSVSQELGATIAGIAYATSRGIILDRTQATEFSGVLLPVINPSILLKEDSFSDL